MTFQRARLQSGRPSTAPQPGEPSRTTAALAPLPRFSIGNIAVHRSGLPDGLKSGIEALSGVSMDGVRVRYNSPHPARLDALAFARGREIHLAPGQESQLPHEAWHLVQQARGKVRPTTHLEGVAINDDSGLEQEADRMGARALSLAPPSAQAMPPAAAGTGASMAQLRARGPHHAYAGDGPGAVAQLGGGKKAKKERKRRLAAIDRADRGSPRTYSNLDPRTERDLLALERMQPRKTAARKNMSRFTPTVVEAGAGEGRFSGAFKKKFGSRYTATDIADSEGPHGFLSLTRHHKVGGKFGVDANDLGAHFLPNSIDHIVGANPFGAKGIKGASYGLRSENPGGKGKLRYLPDDRFLSGARPLLKPGGSVEIYGRSNILRDHAVSKVPSTGRKGRTHEEQLQVKAAKEKYSGENANPYLEIGPEGLRDLAKSTGYKVRVKRAKQPKNIGKGGNPDTKGGDLDRAESGLKPFNTRFSFTPAEQGYESDEDNPRVDYDSGDESDWDE